MEKVNLFKIGCVFLPLFFTSALAFAQEPKTEIIQLTSIEGDVFIRDDSPFLIDAQNRLYKITPELNPQAYNSILSLTKDNESKGKGLKAQITGKPAKFHSIIEHSFKYKGEQLDTKEATEIKFQDFDIVLIKSTAEAAFKKEEIKITSALPPPPTPQPLAFMLKNIQGEITDTHFDKVIPYIEIKGKDAQKAIAILIPSNTQAIKVVEGQLMNFTPKNVIKEGTKLEIWYEEQGDLNLAKIITILPDSSAAK